MTKVPTPKQSSGEGFSYEDQVVAYYLMWMFTGQSPALQGCGQISRLDCQIPMDEWRGFDDLHLTSSHFNHDVRLVVSIKSSSQFSGKSAPGRSLVEPAWALYLQKESKAMDTHHDRFALICPPHPNPQKDAIQGLSKKAKRQTPEQLSLRLPKEGYANDTERSIHTSFQCPDEWSSGLSESEKLAGHILKRLSVIELDFGSGNSEHKKLVLYICSTLVEQSSDAANLWRVLCETAQEIRNAGGGIDRGDLVAQVREQIAVKAFPDFSKDWELLDQWCVEARAGVKSKVGGEVSLDRGTLVDQTLLGLADSPFVVLTGESGSGKSSLAKDIAKDFSESGHVLWLRGELIASGYFETKKGELGLGHSLQDVLRHGHHSSGLIVLDHAERLIAPASFVELAGFLSLLNFGLHSCPWRLLLVCRDEKWDRVVMEMRNACDFRLKWTNQRVDLPELAELEPILSAFPALRLLAARPHLSRVICNLKVLDLVASQMTMVDDSDTSALLTESDLISWYWKSSVRVSKDGIHLNSLILKIAQNQADIRVFETPESELSDSELEVVMNHSDFFTFDDDRCTVTFSHDLISDWARLRVLISNVATFGSFLETRVKNPRWHTAVRLYALSKLDTDGTGAEWQKLVVAYPNAEFLFIDALIYAVNAGELLEACWQWLCEDECRLLKLYLKRFQHVATAANPNFLELAKGLDISPEDAVLIERIPIYVYWIKVLPVFAKHVDELIQVSPVSVAKLSRNWLKFTQDKWLGRPSAAVLAIAVGKRAIYQSSYGDDDAARAPFDALIYAYPEEPQEVSLLLRKAAGRVVPTSDDLEVFEDYRAPGTVWEESYFHGGGGGRTEELEPWTDGPMYRPNEALRACCLHWDALRGLIYRNANLASELILALLIDKRPPKKEHVDRDRHMFLDDKVGLRDNHDFYPRFYTKGPFLLFLNADPGVGLRTIISLIDFATERWMDTHYKGDAKSAGIDLIILGKKKTFVGDERVLKWFRGTLVSDIVSSALMTVEKWLYNQIDGKNDVNTRIAFILETSMSSAFLGLLSEVGKYSIELFSGVLSPLLLHPYIVYSDRNYFCGLDRQIGTPMGLGFDEWFFNLAREWDGMPHRRNQLERIVLHFFHYDVSIASSLRQAAKDWDNNLPEDHSNLQWFTKQWSSWFNDDNWLEVIDEEGRKMLQFQVPDNLQGDSELLRNNEKRLAMLTFPFSCQQILEDEKVLRDEEVGKFFDSIKEFDQCEVIDDDDLSRIADCVMGGGAVLVCKHREWLNEHPEEELWLISKVDTLVLTPPPCRQFDMPESLDTHGRERFLCDLTVVLWTENVSSEDARSRIGRALFANHYSAASYLMGRAFKSRELLGEDFWQLVNYQLDWASLRFKIRKADYRHQKFDGESVALAQLEKFVTKGYPTELGTWLREAMEGAELLFDHNHPCYYGEGKVSLLHYVPEIDLNQFKSAFEEIMCPSQSESDHERKQFLAFWDQALELCLVRTKFFTEGGEAIDPTLVCASLPHNFENWIFQRITLVISELRPDEPSERYWKPILTLGLTAPTWAEYFFGDLYISAKEKMKPEQFVVLISDMMDFCSQLDSWTALNWHHRRALPSMWLHALGFRSFIGKSYWAPEDSALLISLTERIQGAIGHILNSSEATTKFLSWMLDPSVASIRHELLSSVSESALTKDERWWDESHLAKCMTKYLDLLHHESVIRGADLANQEDFIHLLDRVAKTNEPAAIELQLKLAK